VKGCTRLSRLECLSSKQAFLKAPTLNSKPRQLRKGIKKTQSHVKSTLPVPTPLWSFKCNPIQCMETQLTGVKKLGVNILLLPSEINKV